MKVFERYPLLLEELKRTHWAINIISLRAMLGAIDGGEIAENERQYFHARGSSGEAVDAFGRTLEGAHYASVRDNVGFLMIDGPITPRATAFTDVSGLTSLDVLTSDFKALEADPTVDTIALLIDSPGGAVRGVDDFASVVKASAKQTVAFTWMAGSAAYWIATAADRIVAPSLGTVGSVGVIATLNIPDETESLRSVEIISTQSPLKNIDPTSEDGRAVYQKIVDDLAKVFVAAVAENRGVSEEQVLSRFGRGQMFVARRALDAGMIDAIQDADTFAKSLIKPISVKSNISAFAEQPKGVTVMGNEKETTVLTAEDLRSQYPAAVAEIVAAAKADERDRLRDIEALASECENGLPAVHAAVKTAIDRDKYDPELTHDKMGARLLRVIAEAQVEAKDTYAEPRRAAAELAAQVSVSTPPVAEPTAEDQHKKNVNALVAGFDANEGKVI